MDFCIPQNVDELLKEIEADKLRGNQLVGKGNFQEALSLYEACIAIVIGPTKNPVEIVLPLTREQQQEMLHRTLPSLFSNSALCAIKLENYGQAIESASMVLNLRPSNEDLLVKGYYRRGTAYLLLRNFKLAVRDFKRVATLLGNNQEANMRLKEAEKLLTMERFAAAIAADKPARPSETLVKSDWEIASSYSGPVFRRNEKPEEELFDQFCEYFVNQGRVDKKVILDIVLQVIEQLKALPNVVPVKVEEDEQLIVCGDVHGQFYDLMNIFNKFGKPSEKRRYLFNGDFVDRGSFSLEVILTLYLARLIWPNSVYMTRGNHESKDMTSMYGFAGEVKAKTAESLYELFLESFEHLPLAHTIGGSRPRVFVVHGGLSVDPHVTIEYINSLDRLEESALKTDLLWADPQDNVGSSPSKRGVSRHFGPDITVHFLVVNDLDLIVRSHEMMMNGYQACHDGRLVTVFSAPNYCDQMNNAGAVLIFTKKSLDSAKDPEALYEAHKFEAVTDKPNIPAMHYSQLFRQGGLF